MVSVSESEWQREDCCFDRVQGELITRHLIENNIEGDVLDIACGDGLLTKVISKNQYIASIYGIDSSEKAIMAAKRRKYSCPVTFCSSLFEKFSFENKFDSILAINILEHVDNQINFLKKIKSFLKKDSKVFIYVPNADSFHSLLAVEMGVIPEKYHLNQWQKDFVGHTIHYDMNLLSSHIKTSGLTIVDIGSIIFKPFSNPQMDFLLSSENWGKKNKENQAIRGWALSKEKFFSGLYNLGKMPEIKKYGSTLYAFCTL
jgi:2-polyprenyl-3-methyl-5-hydroxy-6-metoxy-1,4-benzoquinol methylase